MLKALGNYKKKFLFIYLPQVEIKTRFTSKVEFESCDTILIDVKVSVIIPAFNEEKYIGKCLESLINQTAPADEIIVVDNNSKDKTAAIAREFDVRIVREKKQGMIPARNRGFNEAKYEIIARCDADAILPKDWIKKIKRNFEKRKIDALLGPVIFYDLPIKTSFFSKMLIHSTKLLNKDNILIGPNMVLTKSIWQKVKNDVCLSTDEVQEDIDLALHIKHYKGVIHYDKTLVASISARRLKYNPLSFFVVYPIRSIETFLNH